MSKGKHSHPRMRMQGRSSIPLRGTSGRTRHTKNQAPPSTDTDRRSEHLRAALSHDVALKLPPIWEVNHEINLIDPEKCIHYCLPKCPEHFHKELSQKIERYTTTQWWIPAVAHQAVPMLCIPKKNGKLRTVFDL